MAGAHHADGRLGHGFRCKPSVLVYFLIRRRRPKPLQPNGCAFVPNVPFPAKGSGRLDSNPRIDGRREYLFLVAYRLFGEQFPGRHRNDARGDAVFSQQALCPQSDVRFGTGADENDLRIRHVAKDVGSHCRLSGRRVPFPVQREQLLARQHQGRGPVLPLKGHFPPHSRLVGVGRPEDDQVGNGSQGRQVLHRLVRRPILAEADTVVGEDVNNGLPHHRRQANRRPHVI